MGVSIARASFCLVAVALDPVSDLRVMRTIAFLDAGLGTAEKKGAFLRIANRPTAVR